MANTDLLLAGTAGVSLMFAAPSGTALPTDATTALAAAFKDAGYISQDGVGFSHSLNTNDTNAYGTLPAVRVLQSARSDTATVTMLEYLNTTAQEVYNKLPLGSIVVSSVDGSFSYTQGANRVERYVLAFQIVDGLNIVRKVLPNAEVTGMGDETFNAQAVASLNATITAYPDDTGTSVYTYVIADALKA